MNTVKKVLLGHNGETLDIYFPYTTHLISEIKKISGRKLNKEKKCWGAPFSLGAIETLQNLGFVIDEKIDDLLPKQTKTIRTIKIPGLGGNLRKYQNEGVLQFKIFNGKAICGDDQGLGKTIQAAAYLQLNPHLRPAIIVVPGAIKLDWKKEINQWLSSKKKIKVLFGRYSEKTLPIIDTDIVIINYAILAYNKICPKCKGKKKIFEKDNGVGCCRKCKACNSTGKITKCREDIKTLNPKIVIWDEIHRLAKEKSQRTIASFDLSKMVKNKLGLTGTLLEDSRHVDAYWPIKIINPAIFPSFFQYARKYCNATMTFFGWDFSGNSNGNELNGILYENVFFRRLKKNVAKDIPSKSRKVVPLEIDNRREYRQAETNFIKWAINNKPNYKVIQGILENKGHVDNKSDKGQLVLAQIQAMTQLAVKGKMKQAILWIKNFLDSKEKLVIFGHHIEIIKILTDEFKPICVSIIGKKNSRRKHEAKEIFQNDPKCKLIIGSESMREGYTLTAACNTCFLEFWPKGTWHDQGEDRVHRIGQTLPVISHYLIASNTLEEDKADRIDTKRQKNANTLDKMEISDENMIVKLLEKAEREGRK